MGNVCGVGVFVAEHVLLAGGRTQQCRESSVEKRAIVIAGAKQRLFPKFRSKGKWQA